MYIKVIKPRVTEARYRINLFVSRFPLVNKDQNQHLRIKYELMPLIVQCHSAACYITHYNPNKPH